MAGALLYELGLVPADRPLPTGQAAIASLLAKLSSKAAKAPKTRRLTMQAVTTESCASGGTVTTDDPSARIRPATRITTKPMQVLTRRIASCRLGMTDVNLDDRPSACPANFSTRNSDAKQTSLSNFAPPSYQLPHIITDQLHHGAKVSGTAMMQLSPRDPSASHRIVTEAAPGRSDIPIDT